MFELLIGLFLHCSTGIPIENVADIKGIEHTQVYSYFNNLFFNILLLLLSPCIIAIYAFLLLFPFLFNFPNIFLFPISFSLLFLCFIFLYSLIISLSHYFQSPLPPHIFSFFLPHSSLTFFPFYCGIFPLIISPHLPELQHNVVRPR